MTTPIRVEDIPALDRPVAGPLAANEDQRIVELLGSLRDDDWSKPTDCPLWDVRAMASHVLGGIEAFASFPQFLHQMRGAKKEAAMVPSSMA